MIHQMNPICHKQSTDAAYIYNFHKRSLERPAKFRFGFIKRQLESKKNSANSEFGSLLWDGKERGGAREGKGKRKQSIQHHLVCVC